MAAGHNQTMQANHTNGVDLGSEKTEKLIALLKLIEDAESAQEAVWLPESDRERVEEIRTDIEEQTGRN